MEILRLDREKPDSHWYDRRNWGGTTLPWSEFERLANSLELLSESGSSLVYEPQFQLAIDNLRQLSGESPRLLRGLRSSAPPRADLH